MNTLRWIEERHMERDNIYQHQRGAEGPITQGAACATRHRRREWAATSTTPATSHPSSLDTGKYIKGRETLSLETHAYPSVILFYPFFFLLFPFLPPLFLLLFHSVG